VSLAKLRKHHAAPVLGIDASTNSLAFAVFDGKPVKYGKIVFNGANQPDKLKDIRLKTDSIVVHFGIENVAIESAIMVRSSGTAIKISMALGTIISSLATNGCSISEVKPSEWQNFIGNKNLTKAQKDKLKLDHPGYGDAWYRNKAREQRKQYTMDFFNEKYGTNIKDNDVGDALGIAYYLYSKMGGQ